MGVDEKILDAEFGQEAVHPRRVATLGEPDAARRAAEDAPVRAHRHRQLGIEALGVRGEHGGNSRGSRRR